jgi:signal transduction histidine kinase
MPLFSGGGAAGELMRSLDWSRTPLGPVDRWPQSLRTSVSICLSSRFPILIWWGPELVKLYNAAYREILRAKHPAAMGARGRDVWPEIWHIIGPMLSSVMERGESTWSENIMLPLERKGFAEECYFTFSYSPIRDESGDVGGVFTAVTETTQQVLSERRLRTLRDLGALSARAQSEVEASRELVEILGSNKADVPDCALLGLDGARSAFDPARSYGLPADPSGALLSAVKASLEGVDLGVTRNPWGEGGGEWALVLPLPAPGQDSALVIALSPMLPVDEAYRGFLRTVGDQAGAVLANARALESERRRAEALAEIDRAKTAFFSNISHEFRTPLTLMTGPLSDLLDGAHGALGGPQRQQLELVERNALRLMKLVNMLLDFARIEAGRAEAAYEPTDLAALTSDLASSFRASVERAGLRFEVACEVPPEPIFVDREMWEKIVLNLLSNAFKFTFEGGISLSLRAADHEVILEVRDSGTGIPESEIPRLFERFHRVQGARSRTYEGSGIGLALVSELVGMHGGRIAVVSRVGEGTSFAVHIPRGRAHLPPERIGAGRRLPSTGIAASAYVQEAMRWLPDGGKTVAEAGVVTARPGARILVADDNADMREYVTHVLAPRWNVEAVADGAAALAAARRSRPDLILTDVMMPGLDGFGLLREIRKDRDLTAVPVIMLSARAGEEARIDGLEAGADDYVVKPFVARELLARVSTHLQLAGAREAAVRERERMYGVFEQAPVPIAVFSGPDFTYELANSRFLQAVGKRTLAGLKLREESPELVGTPLFEVLARVWATGEPYAADEYLARLRRPDGQIEDRWFNFDLQRLPGPSGGANSMMLVAMDVSDQVRARLRLEEAGRERDVLLAREQQARRDAEAANRAKDEFLAMLGHELRNPLAPILTAMQILQLKGVATREAEIVQRQLRHMIRLVDDLLDVARLARGKIELKKRAVELAPLIGRAVEMASPLLEQGQHHLDVDVEEGIVVEADPDRFAQVLSNLLMNACKYSPPASHIRLMARRDDTAIEVTVRDDGIGIAPEMLRRVFEPFVQDPSRRATSSGGLGLGLTIARNLIELHGGSIEARSEGAGKGSEFVVRVPALPISVSSGREARLPSLEARPPTAARVLVVDDNRDAAELLAYALQGAGYDVRTAADGPEALRLVNAFVPHVALLDIGLPVMDGYELGAALRSRFADLALFAVTGYGTAADRGRAEAAGFSGHFVKPVDLDEIFVALRQACAVLASA